mgnify:CR=1 FL=1
METAACDIDDSCSNFRINDNVFHGLKDNGTAIQDILPTGATTLNDPVFSADFSTVVVNDSIWIYTAGISPNASSFSIILNGTFDLQKQIWRNNDIFVIFTQKETNITGKWSFILQIYKIIDSSTKIIGDFVGQTTDSSLIVVSPKLTKIIVYGKDSTDSTKSYYFAKTINYNT